MGESGDTTTWRNRVLEGLLVLPVLFAILTGVLDYGWFFGQQLAMNSAVAQAARAGSVTPPSENPTAAAERTLGAALHAAGFVRPGKGSVKLVGRAPDQAIEVSSAVRYSAPFGLVPVPQLVAARLVMRMEHQPGERVAGGIAKR